MFRQPIPFDACRVIDKPELAQQFKPTVYMHRKSRYIPMDVDDYIRYCEPDTWGKVFKNEVTHLRPNMEELADVQEVLEPTVHALVTQVVDEDHPLRGYFLVHYIMFYANQPDTHICCGRPWCFRVCGSGHEADLEWISVLVEPDARKIRATFYACHGLREAQWVNRTLENPYDRPNVFMALDTHASFPTGGWKWRLWGSHVDKCPRNRGCLRKTSPLGYKLKVLDQEHPWLAYKGRMARGIRSLGAPGRLDLPAVADPLFSSGSQFRRRFFRCR